MDDYRVFVVFTYINNNDNDNPSKLVFQFYNHNLKTLNYANNMELRGNYLYNKPFQGEELFFKSIYLKNQYVIFVYHFNNYIRFELYKINYQIETKIISPIDVTIRYVDNYFDIYTSLNDLVKIDEKRIAFIYTNAIVDNNDYDFGGDPPDYSSIHKIDTDRKLTIAIFFYFSYFYINIEIKIKI